MVRPIQSCYDFPVLTSLINSLEKVLVGWFQKVTNMLQGVLLACAGLAQSQAEINARLEKMEINQEHANEVIIDLLEQVLAALIPGPVASFQWTIVDPETGDVVAQFTIPIGETYMPAVVLNRHTSRLVTLVPMDEDRNVTKLDGPATIGSANPAVTILNPSDDGLSFTMRAEGVAGTGQVSITGDADLGAGVVPIVSTADVTVPAGNAVTLEMTIGDEVPNPADPPVEQPTGDGTDVPQTESVRSSKGQK